MSLGHGHHAHSQHAHSHHVHAHDAAERAQMSTAERAATWLSLACAVHCLLMPLVITVLPLLGAAGLGELEPAGHLALTLLVVASALLGVTWGYRRHRDLRIVWATAIGLGAYLLGHWLEDSWYGLGLAVLGALTLAASSFVGARLSHTCRDASCTP